MITNPHLVSLGAGYLFTDSEITIELTNARAARSRDSALTTTL